MKFVKGIGVSPGIAIGKAFPYAGRSTSVPAYDITPAQIPREKARFREALQEAARELEELSARTHPQTGEVERKFLDSHILMLRDPELIERVQSELAEQKKNVEWVLQEVITAITAKLDSSDDEYMRERSADFQDVYSRILGHLLKAQRVSLTSLAEDCVLVAHNLLPSDVISMDKRRVMGLASDSGSKTSHVAILARSFAIPAVLGLSEASRQVQQGDTVIVDGHQGVVIVSPDEAT